VADGHLPAAAAGARLRTAPMETTVTGGCQCGAVRYAITGAPLLVALCHCSLCRRANGAPAVAWAMFKEEQVAVEGRLAAYASSPEARRGFCGACGTPISFTATFIPGLVDITVGSLDRPEAMPPALHYWDSRRLPWLRLADDLPRHAGLPPEPVTGP
jgi:hypothetical protein